MGGRFFLEVGLVRCLGTGRFARRSFRFGRVFERMVCEDRWIEIRSRRRSCVVYNYFSESISCFYRLGRFEKE